MNSIANLADQLVKKCLQEIPPLAQIPAITRKKNAKAQAVSLDVRMERIHATAKAIRKANNLGVIKLARMLMQVQRGLLSAGYAPALVKKLVFSILANALVGK